MNILQITSSGAKLCDERGESAGISLGFSLGQHLALQFDLRGAPGTDGTLLPLDPETISGCRSFYFALSNVWNAANEPLFLRTSGITLAANADSTVLCVNVPDTGAAALVAALAGKPNAVFNAELGGLDADGLAIFVWQFPLTVNNRIYLGGDAPESVSGDPAYLTAAQVIALVEDRSLTAAKSFEIGGVSEGSASVTLTAGTSADLALHFVLPCGEPGAPGADGRDGAIITGAGIVSLAVSGGTAAVAVNEITGGTATIPVSGGTIVFTETFLGVEGRCEYDLIDANGKNITTDPSLTRQWTDEGYLVALSGGFTGAAYALKPCGIRGAKGDPGTGSVPFPGGTVSVTPADVYPSLRGGVPGSTDLDDYRHHWGVEEGFPPISVYVDAGASSPIIANISSLDLTGAASLEDVAASLQEAIRANAPNRKWQLKNMIVSWSNGRFTLKSGSGTCNSITFYDEDQGDMPLGLITGLRSDRSPVFIPGGETASFDVAPGTKYIVSGYTEILDLAAVDASGAKSIVLWKSGTEVPTVSYPSYAGLVGAMPELAAYKNYFVKVETGFISVSEYTPGQN